MRIEPHNTIVRFVLFSKRHGGILIFQVRDLGLIFADRYFRLSRSGCRPDRGTSPSVIRPALPRPTEDLHHAPPNAQ